MLIEKLKKHEERMWYAQKTIEHGWSRSVLVYLSAVDDLLRHDGDNPSIGMILCRTKDNVFVEYALRNFNRPIGVAEYETKLVESLPKELKSSLPTVKEIEAELEQDITNIESPDKKKKGRKKKLLV